jgi:hypothetical protein
MAQLVLLTATVAGCGQLSDAAPAPSVSASPPPEWHGLASECPVLRDPPYGVSARGKLVAPKTVDNAEQYEVRCNYPAPAALPLLSIDVLIARGVDGYARTEQDYRRERAAAGRLVSFDVADLPQVGDAAFAMYDQATWILSVRTRSGNATVTMEIIVGSEVAKSWSVTAPLQQQVPALAAVTKDFLGSLR